MRCVGLVLAFLLCSASALADEVPERLTVSRHRLHARLGAGVALVSEELTLDADGAIGVPTRLNLVLPNGAVLLALEACSPSGACRTGQAMLDATVVHDTARYGYRAPAAPPLVLATQGRAWITLDVAALDPGASVIRVAWSVRTSTIGGVDRILVPPRAREVEVTLASITLDALSVDDGASTRTVGAGRSFELAGTNPAGSVRIERHAVGGAGLLRVVAPRPAPSTDPLVIFLDVSPTALLRADELRALLRATLDALPAATPVLIVAFARTARVVVSAEAGAIGELGVAFPTDLGPSTSAAAALELLRSLALPSHRSLWLGDGGLSWGADEDRAMVALRQSGLEVVSLTGPGIDDRLGPPVLADPIADPRAMARALPGLLAPSIVTLVDGVTVRTRAGGDSLVGLTRRPAGATAAPLPESAYVPHLASALGAPIDPPELITLDPIDRDAARKTVQGRLAIFRSGGGLAPPGARIRWCRGTCGLRVVGGVSRGTLRRIVRRTVTPRVRGCFAEERVRHPDWQGRATLVLGLEGPEVAYADVQTESPELRACILASVQHVLPPIPDGDERARVMVRYPFVYVPPEPPPEPARVPLGQDTSAALDGLFGAEPAVPPPALAAQ